MQDRDDEIWKPAKILKPVKTSSSLVAHPMVRVVGGGVLVSGVTLLGFKLIGWAAVLLSAMSWFAMPIAIGAGVLYGIREYSRKR